MRFLPLFFDLTAGPVLLVGAGAQALAKLRILQAAGAKVRWYVLSPEETLNADASLVERHVGLPSDEDFIGAIALVASVDKSTDEALAKRARAMNLPVNIVDRPELSTFIFPAIVDRGDVVVAVGTSGTSPVLARRLRERIEELLPERIGADMTGIAVDERDIDAVCERRGGDERRGEDDRLNVGDRLQKFLRRSIPL